MHHNTRTDGWFQDSIEELTLRESLPPEEITTILTESILEYFSEIITLEQLIETVQTIKTHPHHLLTEKHQPIISEIIDLSASVSDEEEQSEAIYLTLTKILQQLTKKELTAS